MKLRYYQEIAVTAVLNFLKHRDGNPLISIPTGGGKSIILAELIRRVLEETPQARICVVAHVKELVKQNSEKMKMVVQDADIGIYSAGLNCKDASHQITFAGIQSIGKKSDTFDHFDLIIIDEAHRIPRSGDGMYRTFIKDQQEKSPTTKVCGLTATPFRTTSGFIFGNDQILTHLVYESDLQQLIKDGYLTRPVNPMINFKADMKGIKIQNGDFSLSEMESVYIDEKLCMNMCRELAVFHPERKKWIVFCTGIEHAETVTENLNLLGIPSECIHSKMPKEQRDKTIEFFQAGGFSALVNVGVLTEGFDDHAIDLVCLMRSTMSPGLFTQMVGRGLRIHPDKKDCAIVDFGSNITRHGAVDKITSKHIKAFFDPEKNNYRDCPDCEAQVSYTFDKCPECGLDFEKNERKVRLMRQAASNEVLSRKKNRWCNIDRVFFFEHLSKREDAIPVMKVTYQCGFYISFCEYICIEHDNYAGDKAEAWWHTVTSLPMPKTTREAVEICKAGGIRFPSEILVDESAKYPVIKEFKFVEEIA